jgi:hypothetical protein
MIFAIDYSAICYSGLSGSRMHIESTEMWFLRRMMRIPWIARKTNADVLIEAIELGHLIADLRGRQAKFIGHVLREKKLEGIVTTGKICGKRDR